ncbi:4-hydroxy-tetrahydrodipicolinate synthase [Mangrovibacillus cuniculi]|uniref:4-hydroxy-tetrahydrodipicolinate synthase n=1 Tax=Mangrovibacillus cuniculi TaxID=2593652 RepID=A0A7S8CAG5_9BACI|nr:4-hydroxy-tetrahydrodipicolinate synthase [Mangrovibacillus cuniculi]QPC46396.1 4-hydroxy-tetrahydrodipicolinate synthase [Mangrovibacillus cuniculi]
MIYFGKVSTAMVTPFDAKGNIDFPKMTTLIDYLIENGTDSLVVGGTTGESPTLTSEEKVAIFRHAVKVVKGRIPVIAGTGSNNTHASIELTKKAEDAGVDAVMVVAPYYNKPNQEGLYQHFKAVAEATTLPVMLYNVPGRSIVSILPETVIKLSAIDNVVAVKDAGGDLDNMAALISGTSDDFMVYSGDDNLTLPAIAVGATGIVSVASHVIGNQMQEMIELYSNGKVKEAGDLHRKLLPLMQGIFMAPSPTPIKTALQMSGLDVGPVRLPLVPLTESERSALHSLLSVTVS